MHTRIEISGFFYRKFCIQSTFYILLLYLLNPLHGASQNDQYVVQKWGVEHGLPQSTVRCITQTPDGYIWAGTWSGLARFDGIRMTTFNSRNTPALSVSNIMSLFTDSRGRMWIGTDAGGLVFYERGAFIKVDSASGFQATRILSMNEDRKGRVWFATEVGVYVYNGQQFLHFTEEDGLIRTYANQVQPLSDGSMYLGFVGLGSRVRFEEDKLSVKETFHVGGFHIGIDSSDVLWFGIPQKGLVRRNHGEDSLERRLSGLKLRETYVLQNGDRWITTTNDIRILSGSGIRTLDRIDDVTFEGITTVFEDREGLIWMGQEKSGLIRLRKKLVHVLSTQNDYSFDYVMSGLQDRAGNVWIATWDNGLFKSADTSLSEFIPVPFPDSVSAFNTLFEGKDGTIYAGTWGNGLYAIRDGTPRKISGEFLSPTHSIVSVVEDINGELWIGTAHHGVIHIKDGKEILWNTENGLSSNRTNAILVARNGDVWITASASGVNRISNGELTVFKKGNGLNDNYAAPMYQDYDGAIWIGTDRGLNRWKDGKFSYVTANQGLVDEHIAQIMEDDLGNFWIGAIHGIYRVSKEELNAAADGTIPSIRYFSLGKEDGMLNEEAGGGGTPRNWKTSDGRLWFSSRGVVIVDPDKVTENMVPPDVIIEEAWVENLSRTVADSIFLQPGETKIEFRYTGINFTSPGKIRFSYYLEGFEQEWNDAGNQRIARYTNLAPGSYRFKIKAQNSAGMWSREDASVAVMVLPPFYATWWFRVFVIIGFLSIGPFIYWRRVSNLKIEQKRQQEFSRRLIAEQESERQRIANELHDSLGQNLLVLKNRVLVAEQENGDMHLHDMSLLISQTIEEVRSISHNLRPHQLDQLGVTKAIRALARNVSESSGIPIQIDLEDIDEVLQGDEEIGLFRIIQESLNNIVKHSSASNATISITRETGEVNVTVRDNGKGMDIAQEQSREELGHGFGLSGMRERSRLFGWTIAIRSQPNQGTIVSILIPIKATSS